MQVRIQIMMSERLKYKVRKWITINTNESGGLEDGSSKGVASL